MISDAFSNTVDFLSKAGTIGDIIIGFSLALGTAAIVIWIKERRKNTERPNDVKSGKTFLAMALAFYAIFAITVAFHLNEQGHFQKVEDTSIYDKIEPVNGGN